MAGIIVADTIQSGGSFIRLNSASQTVATINAAGIYANTGNLLIAANGTIGVASITNTAITGTMTQAQIGNGVAGTGPAFSAYHSVSQSISANVNTKIALNTEVFDTNNNFDNATNYRFTPTVAGYYFINGGVMLATVNTAQWVQIALYKNGSEYRRGVCAITGQSGAYPQSIATGLIYFNGSTDYVELYVYTNANLGTNNNGTLHVFLEGHLVRAA